jgi:deoxyribodipyrimidine photo-lyase
VSHAEPLLRFSDSDPRVRRLNDRPLNPRGEFVVYWCQIQRRGLDNAALAYAIDRANELNLPCVVYEALRPDYLYASDRFHTFVIEGARETARVLANRGIAHAFFLPKTPEEARGVVKKIAARAAMIVSDDYPTFVIAEHNAAAAKKVTCPFVVVDDCTAIPMSLFPKQEFAARTIRPKIARIEEAWLTPIDEPTPKKKSPRAIDWPFESVTWKNVDIEKLVASCAIDHTVDAVAEFPGGSHEAEARLETFVRRKLRAYAIDRNEPSREGTSHLSPYLHFGMVSARRVALVAKGAEDSESRTAFLEQLLVRRGLAFNFARTCKDHRDYSALPTWAKETLAKHATDTRYVELSIEDLDAARSPDELWNAAQNELKSRGIIHNYARMLWGKLPITWMRDPKDAHATVVHLNDKYALDGRDPDGYTNISWCFGLHDRPWPERAIFGTVRSMTSKSARSKLEFEDYISAYGSRGGRASLF